MRPATANMALVTRWQSRCKTRCFLRTSSTATAAPTIIKPATMMVTMMAMMMMMMMMITTTMPEAIIMVSAETAEIFAEMVAIKN